MEISAASGQVSVMVPKMLAGICYCMAWDRIAIQFAEVWRCLLKE